MDFLSIAGFLAVMAFAAAAMAITGFGFALMSLALLGLWMDVAEASIIIAPAASVLSIILFYRLRSHFKWKGITPLFVSHLIAVPFGALLLLYASTRWLELILAAIMLVAAAQSFFAARLSKIEHWHPLSAGIPCGFAGGLLTGALGTGGPPLVSFLLNRPIDRFQYVAAMQLMIGIGAILRLVQLSFWGRFHLQHFNMILPSLAATALGTFAGLHLLNRLDDHSVKKIMRWFLFLCAIWYLAKP